MIVIVLIVFIVRMIVTAVMVMIPMVFDRSVIINWGIIMVMLNPSMLVIQAMLVIVAGSVGHRHRRGHSGTGKDRSATAQRAGFSGLVDQVGRAHMQQQASDNGEHHPERLGVEQIGVGRRNRGCAKGRRSGRQKRKHHGAHV